MVRIAALVFALALPISGSQPTPGAPQVAPPAPKGVPVAAVVVAYRLPLSGAPRVLTLFDPPPIRYQAGHLGVDLAAAAGAPVLAAGPGTVTFAGPVAGRTVVVINHPDGVRTEYEPLAPTVRAGSVVRAGQPIGVVAGAHTSCPSGCLHWGARRGSTYLDPMSLLAKLGPVRLIPWAR